MCVDCTREHRLIARALIAGTPLTPMPSHGDHADKIADWIEVRRTLTLLFDSLPIDTAEAQDPAITQAHDEAMRSMESMDAFTLHSMCAFLVEMRNFMEFLSLRTNAAASMRALIGDVAMQHLVPRRRAMLAVAEAVNEGMLSSRNVHMVFVVDDDTGTTNEPGGSDGAD